MKNFKLFLSENKESKYNIFVDLDGTLCDFIKGFEKEVGMTPKEYVSKNNAASTWEVIRQFNKKWWANLEWLPGSKKLYDYIMSLNIPVKVLTTAPRDSQESRDGKNEWVKKNTDIKEVVFSEHKEQMVKSKYDILIDDKEENITKWEKRGGNGIRCTSPEKALKELKEIFK